MYWHRHPLRLQYSTGNSSAQQRQPQRQVVNGTGREDGAHRDWQSPVYSLIAFQVLVFLLTHGGTGLVPAADLGLSLRSPQWWQWLSSGFVWARTQDLFEGVFMTYVFGRLVERQHGLVGVWAVFIASVLGEGSSTLRFFVFG